MSTCLWSLSEKRKRQSTLQPQRTITNHNHNNKTTTYNLHKTEQDLSSIDSIYTLLVRLMYFGLVLLTAYGIFASDQCTNED